MSEKVAKDKRIRSSYSMTANMFLSFMITFAAGTICFEGFMPEKFVAVYSAALIAVCFLTWFALSFISGKKGKWLFVVYSALFWILPQVIIYLANDGPEVFRKSITMYLLSEFSAILVTAPAEAAGSVINVKALPLTIIIILLCVLSYFAGYLVDDARKRQELERNHD